MRVIVTVVVFHVLQAKHVITSKMNHPDFPMGASPANVPVLRLFYTV